MKNRTKLASFIHALKFDVPFITQVEVPIIPDWQPPIHEPPHDPDNAWQIGSLITDKDMARPLNVFGRAMPGGRGEPAARRPMRPILFAL